MSPPPRVVLVVVDQSNQSLNSLVWAQDNILRAGDHVTILNVAVIDEDDSFAEDLSMDDPLVYAQSPQLLAARQRAMEASERFVNSVLASSQPFAERVKCIFDGKLLTQDGSIGESIVKWINTKSQVDLIVCGSRGLGTFKRAMLAAVGLGSVSDYLCHNAQVPVLVYHQPQHFNARAKEQ